MQELLAKLSLDRKVRLLTGADHWALHDEPAIGLRQIVTSDGPAGVRGRLWDERTPSANIPAPTALAATWDEARVERIARLLASEARAKGVDVLLAPTVNLHRTPFGGRAFECFSEDPLLTGRIGAAYVRGLQSEGVAATVKHFVANDSETERFTLNAVVGERALRELYLAPFEHIMAEHPWALMAAYNAVNGVTMTESPLLREVLREQWGWDGVVVSDWGAARSVDAQVDLVMPGPDGPFGDALVEAVRAGRVSEAAVDERVARLLRLAARVGALDAPREGPGREGAAPPPAATPPAAAPAPSPAPPAPAPPWTPDAIAAELRSAAAAGIVLARNHGSLLPLQASSLRRVAVVGPNAAEARTLGGGSATVFPPYTVSPLAGLRAALAAEVTHAPGVRTYTRLPVADVRSADVRFLDASGTVLAAEHREVAEFTWLGTLDPAVAAIEVHTTLRAETAGEHVIGCSGPGRFALSMRGEPAFAVELALRDGADPGEALFAPPQHGVPLELAEGETVDVVLRHEVADPRLVAFQLNCDPPFGDADAELDRAVELAREADVAIVVVGTTAETESEGFDRGTLALPGRQDELVQRVNDAQPRTVVVVNAGAPVLLPWLDRVPGVLLAWLPGQEGGHALADVIFGAAEPGGRLPMTWPATEDGLPSVTPADGELRYDEGLAIGYRGAVEPRLPFGHGLGYTTWDYLAMDRSTVRLVNSGTRRGREVIQVYASRPDSAIERPERWLAGFVTVDADAGEEIVIDVPLAPRAFAHWGDNGWETEPGTFVLEAGRSVADLRVRSEITV